MTLALLTNVNELISMMLTNANERISMMLARL